MLNRPGSRSALFVRSRSAWDPSSDDDSSKSSSSAEKSYKSPARCRNAWVWRVVGERRSRINGLLLLQLRWRRLLLRLPAPPRVECELQGGPWTECPNPGRRLGRNHPCILYLATQVKGVRAVEPAKRSSRRLQPWVRALEEAAIRAVLERRVWLCTIGRSPGEILGALHACAGEACAIVSP